MLRRRVSPPTPIIIALDQGGPVWCGEAIVNLDASGQVLFASVNLARKPTQSGVGEAPVPMETAIRTVRPNPSRDDVAVAFSLRAAAAVDLAVYDVAGRRVRTLAAESLPAGHHARTWNGLDDLGRATPAGLFFIRLGAVIGRHEEVRPNALTTWCRLSGGRRAPAAGPRIGVAPVRPDPFFSP